MGESATGLTSSKNASLAVAPPRPSPTYTTVRPLKACERESTLCMYVRVHVCGCVLCMYVFICIHVYVVCVCRLP